MPEEVFNAGAISGAITNPNSVSALAHAAMYYDEIRKNHADVDKIARNTGERHG